MSTDWIGPVALHLLDGLSVTLLVSLLSILLASTAGVLVGVLCASVTRAWMKILLRLYIDVFRGVPSLITLLFVFFALPHVGIVTSALTASVLGLALWGAANIAEIARGACLSIPPHQTETAHALGMRTVQTMLFVVMPQALRRFLPPYIGQITVLVQASALTSVVGVTDLLGAARQIIERLDYVSGEAWGVPIYGVVLVFFFALCWPLTWLAGWLERRLQR